MITTFGNIPVGTIYMSLPGNDNDCDGTGIYMKVEPFCWEDDDSDDYEYEVNSIALVAPLNNIFNVGHWTWEPDDQIVRVLPPLPRLENDWCLR